MKKAINAWSLWGFDGRALSARETLATAKTMGYEGIELTVDQGALSLKTTEEECKELLKLCKEIGIEISSLATGLLWQHPLSSQTKAVREEGIQDLKQCLRIASWLKAKVVLVVPGAVDVPWDPTVEVVPYGLALKTSKASLKRCLPLAEELRVCLALENVWNHMLLSPLELKAFIESFESRFVGAYLDPANLRILGHPEHWIRLLGRKIRSVHVKNWQGDRCAGTLAGFGESIREGDVSWPSVLESLRAVGYDGWLVVEMLPFSRLYEDPPRPVAPCQELAERASKDLDALIKRKGAKA